MACSGCVVVLMLAASFVSAQERGAAGGTRIGDDEQGRPAPLASGLGRLPATFEGELPCADCPGIRTHLDLFADGVYLVRRVYRDRPRVPDEIGRWVLSSDRRVLRLDAGKGRPTLVAVSGDGLLAMLDVDGRPIVSSANTRLERLPWFVPALRTVRATTPPIPVQTFAGTTWRLRRLAGQAADIEDGARQPSLTFSTGGRLSGTTGCNRMSGNYVLDGTTLSLPGTVTTRMACVEGADVEASFTQALRKVASMRLIGDWLELLDTDGLMVARFVS